MQQTTEQLIKHKLEDKEFTSAKKELLNLALLLVKLQHTETSKKRGYVYNHTDIPNYAISIENRHEDDRFFKTYSVRFKVSIEVPEGRFIESIETIYNPNGTGGKPVMYYRSENVFSFNLVHCLPNWKTIVQGALNETNF
jgi:hypothetical protein